MALSKKTLKLLLFAIFLVSFSGVSFVYAESYTGNISISSTGGNCSLVGAWDETTKTCVLDKDIIGTLAVSSPGLVVDGTGHTISKNPLLTNRTGVSLGASNLVF